MAQMPEAAPVIWLWSKNLRMCAQGRRTKGGERGERTTRVKGANEARRAEGASKAAGRRSARTRRGEEESDAQGVKLRHLADVDRNGPAYRQVGQAPASVRRVVKERRDVCEHRVGGEERAQVPRKASTSEGEGGGAAARKREEEERCARARPCDQTHSPLP